MIGKGACAPPPRNRHQRATGIEPTFHLVDKKIGTGRTGFNVQEAEEQSHNSTYIQHKLTWTKERSLGTRQNCFVLLPCSRFAFLFLYRERLNTRLQEDFRLCCYHLSKVAGISGLRKVRCLHLKDVSGTRFSEENHHGDVLSYALQNENVGC